MEESSTTKDDHAATAAIWRHPSYMQAVNTLRYVTPSSPLLHSYLPRYDYSLILQMHATFAYFLVCSGLSLVLRIFNQMRLVVEFDLRTIRVHTFIGIGCIFFCGLTPIGKTSNKWVSSQAKFKLEVNQGAGRTSTKKNQHNVWRRHKSSSRVHRDYLSKWPFMFMQFYLGLVWVLQKKMWLTK